MVYPRKFAEERTAAEWAQLHAGIEFILPARDREIIRAKAALKLTNKELARKFHVSVLEVERSLGRTARTLCTWERNACKWATRFVAVEPWSEDGRSWRPGDGRAPTII